MPRVSPYAVGTAAASEVATRYAGPPTHRAVLMLSDGVPRPVVVAYLYAMTVRQARADARRAR